MHTLLNTLIAITEYSTFTFNSSYTKLLQWIRIPSIPDTIGTALSIQSKESVLISGVVCMVS